MFQTKKLRSELAEQQQFVTHHRAIQSAISSCIATIEFSPDGLILAANELFLGAIGYHRDEVLGKHHRIFCDEEYAASEEYRAFWHILKNGEPHSGTFPRRNKSGDKLWLEATYFPVKDDNGRVQRVMKIASDVTPEHNRMRDHEAAFAAINRSMARIEFKPDGTILDANQNFLLAVGYELDEIQGRHHRMFCQETFYEQNPDFWTRLANGEFKSGQFQRVRSDGGELWLEASYNPVFDESGRVTKVIKFASDITDRVNQAMQTKDAAAVAESTASQTVSRAEEAMEALRQSRDTSEKIEEEVDNANELIGHLNQHSKNIENMVGTISGVADQTNLLALNAAIEAARAGEHGRGFAVVADEVRALAGNTGAVTEEISSVVHKILELSGGLEKQVAQVLLKAVDGKRQVADVTAIVEEIQEGAQRVRSAVQTIGQ